MGLFGFMKKKEADIHGSENAIVAVADGEVIDVAEVSDPVFAQKMMGDSIAFRFSEDRVTITSPADGELTALFPTGHAFGVTMKNGVELLVHIGIDTVNAKGDGFTLHKKKQGDQVKAQEAIVDVDLKKLGVHYDMSTMLIITNANGQEIHFIAPGRVRRGQSVIV